MDSSRSIGAFEADPSGWVGWGGRTMDEMGHGWTDIAFMTEEQYQRRFAERSRGQ